MLPHVTNNFKHFFGRDFVNVYTHTQISSRRRIADHPPRVVGGVNSFRNIVWTDFKYILAFTENGTSQFEFISAFVLILHNLENQQQKSPSNFRGAYIPKTIYDERRKKQPPNFPSHFHSLCTLESIEVINGFKTMQLNYSVILKCITS